MALKASRGGEEMHCYGEANTITYRNGARASVVDPYRGCYGLYAEYQVGKIVRNKEEWKKSFLPGL